MNFTVYIENNLAERIMAVVQTQGKSRNAIIREALEEWCDRHVSVEWEPGFFDFEPIKNLPDFSHYRTELKSVDDDPLL